MRSIYFLLFFCTTIPSLRCTEITLDAAALTAPLVTQSAEEGIVHIVSTPRSIQPLQEQIQELEK